MDLEKLENTSNSDEQQFRLVPAGIDIRTGKSQLAIACSIALLALLVVYAPLLDNPLNRVDSSFLSAVGTALNGGIPNLLASLPRLGDLGSGDGPSAIIPSAKLLWLGLPGAFAQHTINLLTIGLSAVLVAQVTSEVIARCGSRLGASPAIWAGLLFASCPLQSDLLMKLSARAECLACLFYLFALYAYLRFRRTKSAFLLNLALFSTLLAILMRPEGATIPIVITAAEFLLPPASATGAITGRAQRFVAVALFWLTLSFVATVGQLAPDMVPIIHAQRLLQSHQIVEHVQSFDISSLVFPLGLEHLNSKILMAGYGLVAISAVLQAAGGNLVILRVLAWLGIWFVAANPSLYVGWLELNRADFTLGAAPLSMFLAIAALPAAGIVSRALRGPATVVGLLGLSVAAGCWFVATEMQSAAIDHEKPPAGFIWPAAVTGQTPNGAADTEPSGPLYSFRFQQGTVDRLDFEPKSAIRPKGSAFTTELASIAPMSDAIRIMPGKQTVRIWLPETNIDPKAAQVAAIKLLFTSKTGCHTCHSNSLKLIWQTDGASTTANSATIIDINFGQYLVWLGRYKNWTMSNDIKRIGFEFDPGDYFVDVTAIDLIPYAMTSPQLAIRTKSGITRQSSAVPTVSSAVEPEILFDISAIPNATGAKIALHRGSSQFEPGSEQDLYTFLPPAAPTPLFESDFNSSRASIAIPPAILKVSGEYQLQGIALNAEQSEIGLPSQPWKFRVAP